MTMLNPDQNNLLGTTLSAHNHNVLTATIHPKHRLADVLTNLQNRSATQQQLIICPVKSTTLTSEKSEKFLFFENVKCYPHHDQNGIGNVRGDENKPLSLAPPKRCTQTFRQIEKMNGQTREDVLVTFRPKCDKSES